jgi:PEP-CTERM motif
MSRLRKFLISLSAVSILAIVSATAHADPITVVGVGSGNFSTATVDCVFDPSTNTFMFTITNTSNLTQPGSTSTITGIGFDLPPLGNASSSGLNGFTGTQAPSLSSDFDFSDGDLGNLPAGFNNVVLDFGFTTGPSGNFAGGSVNDGLAPGESASFIVSGAAFTGFTGEEICNAIFVRFQNVPEVSGTGSDVGIPSQIPEPSTMLLLGTALIGLGGVVRRRVKRR